MLRDVSPRPPLPRSPPPLEGAGSTRLGAEGTDDGNEAPVVGRDESKVEPELFPPYREDLSTG